MKEADEIAKIHVPAEMVPRAVEVAGRKPRLSLRHYRGIEGMAEGSAWLLNLRLAP